LQIRRGNRCVCLSRIYNKHNFDLSRLNDEHSEKIDQIVEQSFKRKKPVCFLPDSDFSDEAIVMRRHLKDLARNIKQLEDETGSQYFYYGFPFLEGHIDQETYVRGPLVLFPISVFHGQQSRGPVGWYVNFSDSAPIFNHTLFAALEKIGGYQLNDDFESDFEDAVTSFEDSSIPDYEEYLISKVSELLENNGLSLETSEKTESENSSATITLKNITKDDIETLGRQPLRIKNYKIIGSFPQGESAIYQDYDNLISKFQNGDSSDFITDILDEADSPKEFAEDIDEENLENMDKVQDKDLNLILSSDSSQNQVVVASQNRKITLVRGPPGTGKSQVIVNVISNALSRGQTILVVCQKRAALEVVHQRLGEKGLDRYAVLLNKEKEDRAKMYSQLKQILEQPDYYQKDSASAIDSTSRQIDDLIKKHSIISEALSKEYFGGVTVQHLYTKSDGNYVRKLDLNGLGDNIAFADLEDFLFSISQIDANYKKFENEDYSWKNRKDFSQKSSSDKNKIKQILESIIEKSQNCIIFSDSSEQGKLIELTSTYSQISTTVKNLFSKIDSLTTSAQQICSTYGASVSFAQLDDSLKRIESGMILWRKFQNHDKILNLLENKIIEDTKERQLEILDSFSESQEKKSFLKKFVDSESRKKEKTKKEFLERPQYSGKNPQELKNMLENGLELWNLVDNPSQKEYIFEKSVIINDESTQNLLLRTFTDLINANKEYLQNKQELQNNVDSLRELFEKNNMFFDKNQDIEKLITKVTNGKEIFEQIDAFGDFVNDSEVEVIQSKAPQPGELRTYLQRFYDDLKDFDDLQSHDIRKSELDDSKKAILDECISKLDEDENLIDSLRQEIYHYWIEKIEQDYPILKAGHFDDYKQNQERLASLLDKKSELLVRKIINGIESNANFRPGMGNKRTQRETEYNTLSYELGKKRKVKPVRKLLQEYEHILFDIAPCWLASPEMVSSIFPLEQNMFDLVIVDEASQLAAERALPFLYRGERVIIAGDEKQLKPHDLFQIKEEENEDEEDDTLDIESLLLLAKRRYTSNTLQWHYRSHWQELINFSNHAFYNGALQVSPNTEKNPPKPPIEWFHCEGGIWENRSNVAEASKVVDVLYDILKEYRDKEIPTLGIITFNDQQRNVILDEIESRQKENPDFDELYKQVEHPPSGKKDDELFVRNIENVQGDERDIIIFSVGYAQDTEGKFRLQFGTLNQDGGENRLNVAVTRASEKIIVVCSIDPRDMKVEGTKNPGPKRLKDFLVYAQAVSNSDKEKVDQILESLSSAMSQTQQKTKYFDSEFEELVHDRLQSMGYQVDTQVGHSNYRIDLAVLHPKDPTRYILGIECDGAMFHSAKSVRERDVIRQQFLERRGWKIARIWSRNWWKNPTREINRIKEIIDSLV
jgi:superfamily I DNA and/or RNA helicase/very-short-patch-repair endonuclease